MAGGFGGGNWGNNPFGAFGGGPAFSETLSETVPVIESLSSLAGYVETLAEAVSVVEALSILFPIKVVAAEAPTPFTVRVFFSAPLDPFFAPNFDPANYTIAGLTVTEAFPGIDPNTVLLVTTEQGPFTYTVVAASAQSATGDTLDPLHDSADFPGFPVAPTFFATAQSRRKVQLTFATAMVQNLAYTSTVSYLLTDIDGNPIPLVSATPVGPTPNQRLDLVPATDLVPGGYYVVTIVSVQVRTLIADFLITPNADIFQWKETPRPVPTIPIVLSISAFSGEVSGGLLGQPLGQVFFSPSLDLAAPNSAIQVDSISVCTKAFDTYTPPSPPDPSPLYTFSAGGPSGTLGGAVLFTTFDRLLGAKLNLSIEPTDSFAPAVTGPAVAILQEVFDPAFISLLNNSFWTMFNGSGNPFITANNLAPIPPGPTQVIILEGTPTSISESGYGGDGWGGENWG